MQVYRFGEFVLDTRSGELRRAGYRIRLRPQPAAVLEHFLKHPGEVVTRDELRRVLWTEDTFVDFDQGLNSCIKQLRAALQDKRGAPSFLETLPRRGYRFIRSVVAEDPARTDPDVAAATVDLAISGTARIIEGRVHVCLELTDPRTGERVWATEFDCETGDVRYLQSSIGTQMTERLVNTLLRREPRRTVGTTGQTEVVVM